MSPQEEVQFRALCLIELQPSLTQRELASRLGLSLGRTNYVIHALLEKGFLKVGIFMKADNKLQKAAYLLTPTGACHRMRLTQAYVARKQAEFAALKAEIDSLSGESKNAP